MANIVGRQVVIVLTNKSGGGVIAGDVVVIDTSNNDAFTTSTAGAVTIGVGIAQETIASNATGRVLISGQAALVNVNASVTRGNYGKTHTVAKQATDAGASRVTGTFCQFLTGGTTPDAMVYPVDLAGAALSNPMGAVGDIIQGTTAGAPTNLAAPLTGKVLTGAGVTTPVAYKYPPGYEFDYVEKTTSTSITATTEGAATTVVTATAVAYDGSTIILVEFYAHEVEPPAGNHNITLVLYDDTGGGAASIGKVGPFTSPDGTNLGRHLGAILHRRLTPSAATHTYSIRAYVDSGTGSVAAGAGGSGNSMPAFIRSTKVSGGA